MESIGITYLDPTWFKMDQSPVMYQSNGCFCLNAPVANMGILQGSQLNPWSPCFFPYQNCISLSILHFQTHTHNMDLAALPVFQGGYPFPTHTPAIVVVDPRDLMRLRQIVMCLANVFAGTGGLRGTLGSDKHRNQLK